jgi:phospholipase/carboxylesterase
MIIGMHGLGGSPKSFGEVFGGFSPKARIILLRGIKPWGDGFAWWTPTENDTLSSANTSNGIANAADRGAEAISEIEKERPTIGKPILTGFSQGGALSYAVALRHPELISAAYPLSGWLPAPLRVAPISSERPPVFAFHGTDDKTIPLKEGEDAVAALVGFGFPAKLRELPDTAHRMPQVERDDLYQRMSADIAALPQ